MASISALLSITLILVFGAVKMFSQRTLKPEFFLILGTLCIVLFIAVCCKNKSVVMFSDDIEYYYLEKNIASSYYSPDNILYAGDVSSGDLYRSTDGGIAWETVFRIENRIGTIRCVFISNSGTIFVSRGKSGELKRSGNKGKTFKTCLKLSNNASVVWGMAENRKGWLYAAEYSNIDQEERCAYIYRSKNDGKDWVNIYHDPNARHFHFIAVDPYTGYIYAASGDGPKKASLIRSADDGDSWVTLGNKNLDPKIDWQFTSVVFTPKYRIFGEDEPPQSDIVRTADDIHFEKVLIPDGPERHNFWSWGRIDKRGNILFGSYTQHAALRKEMEGVSATANGVIFLSRDEGTTWKKVVDFGLREDHSGTHFASNVKEGSWIYCHMEEDGKSLKIRVK